MLFAKHAFMVAKTSSASRLRFRSNKSSEMSSITYSVKGRAGPSIPAGVRWTPHDRM
jgi:hypothetical protein